MVKPGDWIICPDCGFRVKIESIRDGEAFLEAHKTYFDRHGFRAIITGSSQAVYSAISCSRSLGPLTHKELAGF